MSQEFNIGTTIQLIRLPAYLKTADPMPMLLSPSALELGSIGSITGRKPGNYWVVKFDRGSFLLEAGYMEVASD
jgi:hypothetical protein